LQNQILMLASAYEKRWKFMFVREWERRIAKDQTKENVVAAVIVAVADNGKLGNQKCFRVKFLQSNYKW
jgi:hypothetical protein